MAEIDIVMSVNNEEFYISEMINSLKKQTFSDWKLIIRDNNSNDKTSDIIKKFAEIDDRIILLKNNCLLLPLYLSFDNALKYSTAEYVMFADGDDVWLPNKIEVSYKKIKEIEKNSTNSIPLLCFTDLKVVDEKLNLIHPSMNIYQRGRENSFDLNNTLMTSIACGNTYIFNRKLLDLSLPILDGAIMHDVWFFNIALLFGRVDQLRESTILYRQHGGNFSGSTSKKKNIFKNLKNFKKIGNKIQNRINFSSLLLDKFKNKLSTEQKEILEDLANIKEHNFFKRRKILFKNNFTYKNLFKNLALYLWI